MTSRVPASDPTREKNRREKVGAKLAELRPVTWYLVHLGRVIDPFLMKVSNGRINSTGTNQVVVLTHTGRKSGLERTTPLVYFTDGDDVILIASKGGAPENPIWYLNITANPEVQLHVGPDGGRYRARTAEGAERDRLWNLAVTLYRGYAGYAERTDREIPVVICSPSPEPGGRA
ncbi:nitroreductase family deazaflavin-dependent oxidoreductase [Marmoricola sp. OAE513]|uniref:nitroreductase family deazaflavin-dependent oxidoreductase n=1 Tax=Marmoricola sp. OAE513 TaxID=2817894 RepID=UPI001AE77B5F